MAVVSGADVSLLVVLDLFILGTIALFHKRIESVCLDEEFARLQGVNVLRTNLVLLGLVALAVQVFRSTRHQLIPDQHGAAIRHTARYWHFLDIVWLAMLAAFLLT